MTDPMTTSPSELRALAEKADEGPWRCVWATEYGEMGTVLSTYPEGVEAKSGEWVVRFDDDYGTDQGTNGEFIAAANPQTILSLLDALTEAEAQRDRLQEEQEHGFAAFKASLLRIEEAQRDGLRWRTRAMQVISEAAAFLEGQSSEEQLRAVVDGCTCSCDTETGPNGETRVLHDIDCGLLADSAALLDDPGSQGGRE